MTRSKKRRQKAHEFIRTCDYATVGGHYDCDETDLKYRTNTDHLLCMQHALMWVGEIPLHHEDEGLIREVQKTK